MPREGKKQHKASSRVQNGARKKHKLSNRVVLSRFSKISAGHTTIWKCY